jgi:membrane protein implicated in regulation of membrane protease activity
MNMEPWVLWIIVGLVLVIAELVTGTFYLLVLGVGAFAAALAAWADGSALVQAAAGGIVAIGGAVWVHYWHAAHRKADEGRANFLDRGQPVVMEGWSNEPAGLARVKYRGASWDARVPSSSRPVPGSTLYIDAQEGQTLVVVEAPPR